jgi:hypothetical protein
MRKIRYNIAENRKVDYVKFALFSSIVVGISLLFVFLGIGNLWSSDKRVREQKETVELNEKKMSQLTNDTKKYDSEIRLMSAKWRKPLAFANTLIHGKNFSVIGRLAILEEHLPEGVSVTYLSLDIDKPSQVHFNIASHTLPRLIETYKVFEKYRAVVKDETEDEGLLKAELLLNLGKKTKK